MILDLMSFLLLVSVLAGAAALLAEAGLQGVATPHRRWVWVAALFLGPLLVGWGGFRRLDLLSGVPAGPVPPGDPSGILIPMEALTIQLPDPGTSVQLLLGVLWALSTLAFGVHVIRSHRALDSTGENKDASPGVLRDVSRSGTSKAPADLVISDRFGPAVVGIRRPRIFLPAWALSLPPRQLHLILLHEEEHVQGRDPLVLSAGLLAVGLAPWNPLAWWALGRLRSAVELDCDDRVLRRCPEPGEYGRSLLAVAERCASSPLPLAAFAERPATLTRRIRAMTRSQSPLTRAVGALLLVAAGGVVIVACDAPNPVTEIDPEIVAPDQVSEMAFGEDGEPVVFVDGIRVAGGTVEDLDLDPATIDRVEVIKGGAAEAMYGREGSNGVILIVTKEGAAREAQEPSFTPYTTAPQLLNKSAVSTALQEEYPPLLRDAGVEGTVLVWLYVDENGEVVNAKIEGSSGHEALDQAAMRVTETLEFSPALNGTKPVKVWIQLPITFATR